MQMLIPIPKPLMHLYAYSLIYLFYYFTVCRWTLNSMNYNLLLLFLTSGCPTFEYRKLHVCFCVIFDTSPSFSLILLAFDTEI